MCYHPFRSQKISKKSLVLETLSKGNINKFEIASALNKYSVDN